ncbi:MAG: thymidine kinase [Bacteroidota bacterium]
MEPHVYVRDENGRRAGWIEVVCGSMFSGKTEELIRRLKRARIARQRVALFKPAIDVRYSDEFGDEAVVSHDASAMPSTPVHTADQIHLLVGDAEVVGIDEAQFLGLELVDVCTQLARGGKRVICAGLDQDFLGQPFEPVPSLMAVAEHVTKLHAICVVCGAPANHSQRIVASENRVLVGEAESYEPRCRAHFQPRPEVPPTPREAEPRAAAQPVAPAARSPEAASA